MQHYIIDGNNVIHISRDLALKFRTDPEFARRTLVHMCERKIHAKNIRITIVFDGYPNDNERSSISKIRIVYSFDKKADDVIRNIISTFHNRKQLIIVSNDHEIINYAKIHSCTIQSVKIFLNSTKSSGQNEGQEKTILDDISIEEWRRIFEENDKKK